MTFTNSEDNYQLRDDTLPGLVAWALRELPETGPYTEAQLNRIRRIADEISDLLHWKVGNDSYSRDSYWLFLNHLGLTSDEARFAILALTADPALERTLLGEAFRAYVQRVKNRRISDPYVANWLKTSDRVDF